MYIRRKKGLGNERKKYDDAAFFEKYSQMSRSVQGLKGAGEWHEFREAASGFLRKTGS